MKRIVLLVLVLIGVLFVGMYYYGGHALGKVVEFGIETIVPKLTKTTVKMDHLVISPLSGSGTIHGFEMGNPEGFKSEHAIKFDSAHLKIRLSSLLRGHIVIEKVHVFGPHFNYERKLTTSNLKEILKNLEGTDEPEEEESAEDTKKRKAAEKEIAKKEAEKAEKKEAEAAAEELARKEDVKAAEEKAEEAMEKAEDMIKDLEKKIAEKEDAGTAEEVEKKETEESEVKKAAEVAAKEAEKATKELAKVSTEPGIRIEIKDFLVDGSKVTVRLVGIPVILDLEPIELKNIGTEEGGLPPDELVSEILEDVFKKVLVAVPAAPLNIITGGKE